MTLEDELVAVLAAQCPRSYPGRAPVGVALPYLLWQHIGGTSLRFLDNTAGDKRNAVIQITVWGPNVKAALLLLRGVEDALCAAVDKFIAEPQGEPVTAWDDAHEYDGFLQSFSIWGSR